MNDSFHINTMVFGLVGHPIKQSFSPFIHNVAGELLNLDIIYLPFDVPAANLKDAMKGIVALGIKGFNVTLPHKENIINYLHMVSEEASLIGSVNTVVNDLGKLSGYNTDVHGIIETLAPYKDELVGKTVTIIGAGGSARAAIYALIRNFKPSFINIVNRTEQRAESLKEYFINSMNFDQFRTYELFPPDLIDVFQQSKLIINATQAGMVPDIEDSPVELPEAFNKDQIVFDFVYNPLKTRLMSIAESQGATTINGVRMLIAQAAKSFELWTTKEMPVEKIENALIGYLSA